jgi:hypothetical protein
MKRLRKVAAITILAAMLVGTEKVRASAQEAPPDLRMLMNLDLFEPRHNGAQDAPAPGPSPADDSMLDQIRTLDAMGYLGNHADADAVAPAKAPAQIPSSQPSYDVEGPQQ